MINKILLLCLFILSCKTPKELNSNNCISKLKSELKDTWKYNSDSAYYQTDKSFLQRMDTTYKFCLYNLPIDSVVNILGKPSREFAVNRYIEYLVSKPCEKITKRVQTKCTYYRFFYNENRNITKADVHYIQGSGTP